MNVQSPETPVSSPDGVPHLAPSPIGPQKSRRSPAIPALLGVAALLAVGLFLRARSSGAASGPGARGGPESAASRMKTVRVIPVTTGTIEERLAVTGTLRANQNIDLNSKIAGRVAAVYVNEGQRVRRGQILAALDDTDLRENIAAARANLRTQQVRLQQTIVGLPARVAQVGSNIETARAQVATARARYQQALLNEPTQVTNAQSQVDTARAGINAANSRLRQARDTARQTQLQVNAGISSAQSALAQSRAQLEQVRNGARAQQVAQAQAQVGQAQAQVNLAQAQVRAAETNLNRQTQLFEGGATARANVEAAHTLLATSNAQLGAANAQLEAARQSLSLTREGSRTEEVRAAEEAVNGREAAVRQAQASRGDVLTAQQGVTQALAALAQSQEGLRQAQSNLSTIPITRQETRTAREALNQAETALRQAQSNRAQIPVAQQDVPAARAAVQAAQVQLTQAQNQLSYAKIYSPINGVVNTKNADAGESAAPGTPLFNLVSLDGVYFEAQVPESQLARIKVGQPAQVTVGAVSDKPVIGTVSDIIRVADERLRQFRIRISLPESGNLTPGAFARGQLQTQVISNTLTVPSEVLRVESGKNYVLLAVPDDEAAQIKRRDVQIGTSAGGVTQIIGGVGEGDRVVVGNTVFEDGDKVRIAR
ncbi:MAG: efflux RND transporter periplasmic adaptor subunit, partial [Armatimonadetes bacterium]|nr:efflux RND transporter periplasmic adaptor subunit [Armatimonadota bacterium]